MRMPVRVICARCLGSVELSGEGHVPNATECPNCGQMVTESPYPPGGLTDEFRPRMSDGATPCVDVPVWVNSWSKVSGGQLGRFQLKELLGEGGYGEVFLAFDTKVGRDVALKVLRARRVESKTLARFDREARAAACLRHPNVIRLFDFGQDDGRCWISYEYVKGKTLAVLIAEERLERRTAVAFVIEIANALSHAHGRQITHRDVKPSNVIVDEEGHAFLTDFGLARRLDHDSDLTGTDVVLGSLDYMAPEQAAGRASQADARCDIYSLGIVLFQLLTGHLPVDQPSSLMKGKIHAMKGPLPTPRSHDPSIPLELDRICEKAIELLPTNRFQTAEAFATALKRWLDRPERSRNPAKVWVASVVASLAIGAAGFLMAAVGGETNKHASAIAGADRPEKPGGVSVAPETKPMESPAVAQLEVSLIGNSNSRMVHRSNCPSISNMLEKNQRIFHSMKEATDRGYSRCIRCRPDLDQ